MKLLLLGGTQFVGRHLVMQARAAGHEVTLFHRGKTNPGLFPELEHLLGDRKEDLSALRGRRWDRVIDCCGYLPRVVRMSAELLRDAADHYTFISSISVYRDLDGNAGVLDESAPLATIGDPATEEITGESYGALKALCETAAAAAFGAGRTLTVRPGLIVGPDDHTDRFTWYVARAARGGRMPVPGTPARHHPVIDVRDLAAGMLAMSVDRRTGVVNAAGPNEDGRRGAADSDTGPPPAFGRAVDAAVAAGGAGTRVTWMPAANLAAIGATEEDFPLWWTAPDGAEGGFRIDSSRAFGFGLALRPIEETVMDTLAWHRTRPADAPLKAGPTPEREAELLAAFDRTAGHAG